MVDDEPQIIQLCSMLISTKLQGYTVSQTFGNGKDLVDYVANLRAGQEPDVIITDNRMPIMTGVEAARTLKTMKPNLKIILASAFDMPNEAEECFDAMVKKPYSPNDLLYAISDLTR
ncbi:MAG: response regulator [Rhabdochlamydiaceae bacterium]